MNARELGLPVANLSMSHMTSQGDPEARRHLARAAAESAAHTMRANLEQIVEVVGREAGSLTLAGGLSRSETLARIAASVFGRSLGVASTPEASALGAAFCAGVAVGVWPDLESAARHARARVHEVAAEPDATARYADLHSGWRAQRIAQSEADTLARNRFMAAALVAPVAGEGAAFAPPPRPRILVTAALDDESLAALQALGDVEYASYREAMRLLTGDSLVAALDGVDVFITEIDVVDAGAMLRARDLKVVASCRGDAVNVDAVAARALRIPVLNAPGRNADAVADLAVGFLLMLARKLAGANAFLREPGGKAGDMGRMGRAFNAFQGRELWQKTIGLVGLGAVGRGVARRLDGFGARVVVHDPFLSAEQAALANTELVSLATLLAESDYVSLHAPVSDATRHLIGAAEFAAMKSGACLVNTARAALVDEAALVASLESGHLAGAALDVFSEEPPASSHPLLQMEQVVATPHIGGNTVEVAAHQGRIIADDLARLLRGQAPLHALDVEVADHFDWGAARPELSPAQVAELEHRPGPAVTDLQKDKRADAPGKPSEAVTREAGPAAPADLVESMQAILVGFCQRISNDAALNALAADKDVTLFFTLSDLGLRFWVRLRGGGIRAEPGTPDGEPEVNLKLAAEVFDGMFTGSANPMQAAMDGRLSFTGDTAKAMTLQELQGDLARLYCEARAATGGPGDLSALATEPESTAPMVSAAAALPGRPRVGDVRDELCDIIDELFAQQVITATGGNVSVRVPGQDELWITPSQLFKGDLGPEVLVRIDLEGKALDERARAASSERLIHCAVYANRPQANAVIHAHAPHATILANAGLAFLPVSTEAAFFGDIPRVPFIMPGTAALAEAIGAAAADSWAVLMVNHGLLVGGRSLRRAADMVEIIERSCEIILGCLQVGKQPPVLPDDIVAKLREMGDLIA
jgi:autoinducer 2 (AI-2) kinase